MVTGPENVCARDTSGTSVTIGYQQQSTTTLAVLPVGRLLTDGLEILAARRLHAAEHTRVGYVSAVALAPDGTLDPAADPFVPDSRYFGSFDPDGALTATVRVISNRAPMPLPTLELGTFPRELRRRLENAPDGRVGEVASLAKTRAGGLEYARSAFLQMYLDATSRGEEIWILNVDAPVLRTLQQIDYDIFQVVGGPNSAPVRPVLPVYVEVPRFRPEMFLRGLTLAVVELP